MQHEPTLLRELAMLVALAVGAVLLLHRLRLPAMTGLLLAGALAGPHGLGLVTSQHDIEALAEGGVMLLLFSIGLEFTPGRLQRVGRFVAVGGLLQVGLTIAAVVGVALLTGATLQKGLVYGFVLALSSTAIVLRLLAERGETDAPHGQLILGILIFQDLAVVPLVLLIPLLAGQATGGLGLALLLALLKAAALIGGAILMGRYFLPRFFSWVDATRSREMFLMAVLAVVLGTAYASHAAGISLALGAFVAGLVLAESEFAQRALGDLLPLRDILTSLFFISIGMLFNLRAALGQPLLVAGLLCAIIFGKGFIAMLAALFLRFPARLAWLTGVGLAQFGEFGFVLLGIARASGLIDGSEFDTVLAAGIISMFLTPLLISLAPRLLVGERLLSPLEKLLGVESIDAAQAEDAPREDHVVIVGFGPAGQLLARVLHRYGQPYLILELNVRTVRRFLAQGEPIRYGDIGSAEIMAHAKLGRARALVIMVNDPPSAERAVIAAHHLYPDLPILVRMRFVTDREHLLALGASEVITEELEAGKSMVSSTLAVLGVDRRCAAQALSADATPQAELEAAADVASDQSQPLLGTPG